MDKSEIYETRRLNLWRILNTPRFKGNKSELARVVGKDPSYIQRCLASPDKPKGQRKNIGEDLAREFELALELDKYDLDAEINNDYPSSEGSKGHRIEEESKNAFLVGVGATAGASSTLASLQRLKGTLTEKSYAAVDRIARAAEAGRLTEDDLLLLERIAKRFEHDNDKTP